MSDFVCYIPSYNDSHLARDSVASAFDWHVVISDNASDEPHRSALASLAGPRVEVVRHDRSLGRVGNWKFCVRHFLDRGHSWMKLLAAGDVHKPTALGVYSRAVTAFPQARFIVGNVESVWPDRISTWRQPLPAELVPCEQLQHHTARYGSIFHGPVAALIHADALADGFRFGEDVLNFCADMRFLCGIAERHAAVFLPEVVAEFRAYHRTYFQAKRHSLEHFLEESLVRLRAAEQYEALTGDRIGRNELVKHIAEWCKSGLHGPEDTLQGRPALRQHAGRT